MENQKGMDFKHKEVINIKNGKRLGNVLDVNADLKTGTITSNEMKVIDVFGNKDLEEKDLLKKY